MLGDRNPDFFYLWTGDRFSHLYRSSVFSVSRHHPRARIVFYVFGQTPRSENFDRMVNDGLAEVVSIEPTTVLAALPEQFDHVSEIYASLPAGAHAARSNILRYALLYLHGGTYLDTDVLLVRPFPTLAEHDSMVGREVVWVGDERRVHGDRSVYLSPRTFIWAISWIAVRVDSLLFLGRLRVAARLSGSSGLWAKMQANNAVISARPRSLLAADLLAALRDVDPSVRYSTGPLLLEGVLGKTSSRVKVFGPSAFYVVPPGQSYRLFEDRTLVLGDDVIGVHVAASNHGGRLDRMDQYVPCARTGTVVNDVLNWVDQAISLRGQRESGERPPALTSGDQTEIFKIVGIAR